MPARIIALILVLFMWSCKKNVETEKSRSVNEVMDSVVTRLYKNIPPNQYDSLNDEFILGFLTPEEKKVLSTQYIHFDVNVPVTVSLMRDKGQPHPPFWLDGSGFEKTNQVVKNEEFEYEVWQKNFDTGHVELGINGFDKHRPVYFICVGPQRVEDSLMVTNVYPAYPLETMKVGAFTYHDWSGLELTEVPPSLVGQQLFTTVRGRAREAHIIDSFRKTIFPAAEKPDQVMLTWSNTPLTTIDVQWRTSVDDPHGIVQYWMAGENDTLTTQASVNVVEDRMLYNDRYIHRYTAHLTGLKPGTGYSYRVGSSANSNWSAVEHFRTEAENTTKFSFVWFGDTHCFPDSGKLMTLAEKRNPDAAFYSIAGDIVSTGLNRDDWDKLFGYSGDAFARKPLMPVPGNHDRQDGLGAKLYYDLFSLPMNGPEKVETESSYSFEYGNALYIMIDATSEVADHTAWIEETLSRTKATWKFVMFHFPPYNFEEPYLDIQQAWVPLFDKYHVDMVMGGHIHYYMRSKPMFNGAVVQSFDKGTVYAISISIPSKHNSMTSEPYAVTQYAEGYFYQRIEIDGRVLTYKAVDNHGKVKDEFVIQK